MNLLPFHRVLLHLLIKQVLLNFRYHLRTINPPLRLPLSWKLASPLVFKGLQIFTHQQLVHHAFQQKPLSVDLIQIPFEVFLFF